MQCCLKAQLRPADLVFRLSRSGLTVFRHCIELTLFPHLAVFHESGLLSGQLSTLHLTLSSHRVSAPSQSQSLVSGKESRQHRSSIDPALDAGIYGCLGLSHRRRPAQFSASHAQPIRRGFHAPTQRNQLIH